MRTQIEISAAIHSTEILFCIFNWIVLKFIAPSMSLTNHVQTKIATT